MKWFLIGGALGGAVTAGLALREQKALKRQGALTKAAIDRGASALEVRLQAQGDTFREEIREQAEALGQQVAEATAREWLAVKYGITEELMRSMQAAVPRVAARVSRFLS